MSKLKPAISSDEYAARVFGTESVKGDFTGLPLATSLVAQEGKTTAYGGKAHTLERHTVVAPDVRAQIPYLSAAQYSRIEDVRQSVLQTGLPKTAFHDIKNASHHTAIAIETNRADIDKQFAAGRNRAIVHTEFPTSIGFGFHPEYQNGNQLVETRHLTTLIDRPHAGASSSELVATSYPNIRTNTEGNAFVPYPPRKDFNTLVTDTGAAFSQWSPPGASQTSFSARVEESFTQTKADAAVYGRVPGGVIMASHARGLPTLEKIALAENFEPANVSLRINGTLSFDTAISLEEFAILYEAVFASGEGFVRMGATSTAETFGTDSSNVVGLTLRLADERLGELVFGATGEGNKFATSRHPDYINPLRARIDSISQADSKKFQEIAKSHSSNLARYIFLDYAAVDFNTGQDHLTASNVEVRLSPVVARGSQRAPEYVGGAEEFRRDHPEEYGVVLHLQSSAGYYLTHEPFFARCAAYSAVLAILRRARREGASIEDSELLRAQYDNRLALVSTKGTSNLSSDDAVANHFSRTGKKILECTPFSNLAPSDALCRAMVAHRFASYGKDLETVYNLSQIIDSILSGPPSYDLPREVVEYALSLAEGARFKSWFIEAQERQSYLEVTDPDKLLGDARHLINEASASGLIAHGAALSLAMQFQRVDLLQYALQLHAYAAISPGLGVNQIAIRLQEVVGNVVTPGTCAVWCASLLSRLPENIPSEKTLEEHLSWLCDFEPYRWGLLNGVKYLNNIDWILPDVNTSDLAARIVEIVGVS